MRQDRREVAAVRGGDVMGLAVRVAATPVAVACSVGGRGWRCSSGGLPVCRVTKRFARGQTKDCEEKKQNQRLDEGTNRSF